MKKTNIKIAALALWAIVATMVTFTSCQKDRQNLSSKNNFTQSNYSPMVPNGPILGLIIDYGTRKGAKMNKEHDEEWGTIR